MVENKVCTVCGKKNIRAEKTDGQWRYPSKLVCYNCVMTKEGLLSEIVRHKARSERIGLPISIYEVKSSILVGTFYSEKEAQSAIDKYQERMLSSAELAVVDFPDYNDVTDRFRNTNTNPNSKRNSSQK
jgi:hypothetical protein